MGLCPFRGRVPLLFKENLISFESFLLFFFRLGLGRVKSALKGKSPPPLPSAMVNKRHKTSNKGVRGNLVKSTRSEMQLI